jgi:hypothetical protein
MASNEPLLEKYHCLFQKFCIYMSFVKPSILQKTDAVFCIYKSADFDLIYKKLIVLNTEF